MDEAMQALRDRLERMADSGNNMWAFPEILAVLEEAHGNGGTQPQDAPALQSVSKEA